MPYNVGYKHVCSPNGDPAMRRPTMSIERMLVTRMEFRQYVLHSVMPYNVRYKHACNPVGIPTMRITKRDALPCGLQVNL
eukprot:2130763-Pleurochrysis_carterae.AAC.1